MALPIKNAKITTPFKGKGTHWKTGFHTGVDFAAKEGTKIYAVADGSITSANWGKSYGTHIVQKIGSYYCIYAHLSKKLVKNQQVKKGDLIGLSGNTGNSTGPHLHFELRTNIRWSLGKPIDPSEVLKI